MQCVILAAGEGVRMRPLPLDPPKPMLTILGKPLLEYTIDSLPKEVDDIIIVEGYLGEKIQEYFGGKWKGRRIRYTHQPEKLGTYHALEMAKPLLKDGLFLMLYADDLFGPETYRRLVEKRSMALVVMEVVNPERFGVVTLRPDGTVLEIVEKPEHPTTNLANCGPTALTRAIFDYPPGKSSKGEHFLTEAVAKMAATHPVYTVKPDWWIPIGYPEDLEKAERFLKNL